MAPRRSARGAAAAASQAASQASTATSTPAPTAASSSTPLDGCKIVISGKFTLTQADIKSKVTSLGGAFLTAVSGNTNYLICAKDDFVSKTAKVNSALAKNVPIVSLDWLLDTEKKGAVANPAAYVVSRGSVSQSPAPSQAVPVAAKPSSKRSNPITLSDDDEDAKPQPKKARRGAKAAPAAKPAKGVANGNGAAAANGGAADDQDDDDKPAAPPAAAPKKGGKKGAAKAVKPEPKDDDEEEEEEKKPAAKNKDEKKKPAKKDEVADGQIAKSKSLKVPLDEACMMVGYFVYIDDDRHIWDASLNQTNASNNNNKFYRIQVISNGIGDFKTWTRWGRVGERGAMACLGSGAKEDAMKHFNKKFKDKTGYDWEDRHKPTKSGKYTFIERSYNADSDEEEDDAGDEAGEDGEGKLKWTPPESKLSAPVADLMRLMFNEQYWAATMAELNYDVNKLPLGKLSKSTISRGFQALKDLSALFDKPELAAEEYGMAPAEAAEHLSNSYYSLIPHAFGRNRPPVISEQTLLKKEVELLESLSDMKDADLINKLAKSAADAKGERVHPLDAKYNGLGMQEMTPLDRGEDEFKFIKDYLLLTKGETHGFNYNVQEIFRIERAGEHERFDKLSPLAGPPKDRRLLWHGSRVTNFGGILSQGLRIAPPEAPVTGYMFGKGIYLADMSSKSAQYCAKHTSKGEALLLVCEAELGDPMQELVNAEYNAGEMARKKGMFSTMGQGSTGPKKWRDAGVVHPSLKGVKIPDTSVRPGKTDVKNACLLYNEFIVYDVAQVRLRYLVRVKM